MRDLWDEHGSEARRVGEVARGRGRGRVGEGSASVVWVCSKPRVQLEHAPDDSVETRKGRPKWPPAVLEPKGDADAAALVARQPPLRARKSHTFHLFALHTDAARKERTAPLMIDSLRPHPCLDSTPWAAHTVTLLWQIATCTAPEEQSAIVAQSEARVSEEERSGD